LSPDEAAEFERHLGGGCEICRVEVRAFEATAACLPLALTEAEPPPTVREKLLSRIKRPPAGMHVVRQVEGTWRPSPFPGVSVKTLYLDRETAIVTNLVRMEPGSSYPPHRHAAVEQCLVLEGDIRLDDFVLGPGDYSRNDASSHHKRLHTRDGCLLLIVSSLKDELLDEHM
jgi:anti-sigma factor ChrR (cupin superfamily)